VLHFQSVVQVLILEELAGRRKTRTVLAKSAPFTPSLRHIIAPVERECQQNLGIFEGEAEGSEPFQNGNGILSERTSCFETGTGVETIQAPRKGGLGGKALFPYDH